VQTIEQLLKGELKGEKRLQLSCGLEDFPREVFELCDTLEILDLSGNNLHELPDDFGRLKHLKIVFFSNNNFTVFPAALANCPNLTMIGFKSNRISEFPENALPIVTQWLILTDNKIKKLPESLGDCVFLQKVAFAGNQIAHLPESMSNCKRLELLRISANKLESIPEWLLKLPKLSWLAFSGNPCSHKIENAKINQISWSELEVQQQLGEGASGIISKAVWKFTTTTKEVAIKIFKGEVTSDGYPEDELTTCISTGSHVNLVPLLGEIENHSENKKGIVMELISSEYSNLGNPPSFETCTRDVYEENTVFTVNQLLTIASSVASAAKHLHDKGIVHGDLYAHNTMVNSIGNALLGDFGAATCYDRNSEFAFFLERLDVRAFGCLLEELLERCSEQAHDKMLILAELKNDCFQEEVIKRPSFSEILSALNLLK
jgi:tRNA A-37 threonylcarbamoyl transferase component Bud32